MPLIQDARSLGGLLGIRGRLLRRCGRFLGCCARLFWIGGRLLGVCRRFLWLCGAWMGRRVFGLLLLGFFLLGFLSLRLLVPRLVVLRLLLLGLLPLGSTLPEAVTLHGDTVYVYDCFSSSRNKHHYCMQTLLTPVLNLNTEIGTGNVVGCASATTHAARG